jgi:hypothetical protein
MRAGTLNKQNAHAAIRQTRVASIRKQLSGSDLRSIGRPNKVVAAVLRKPSLFRELFRGLSSGDRVTRMRAADAVEKISLQRPELLSRYKHALLELAACARDKEFRWHMALILPRLSLRSTERAAAVDILYEYLNDSSSIVKTWAMQGLADLAHKDRKLLSTVRLLVQKLTQTGTPAMRARGRKILDQFGRS